MNTAHPSSHSPAHLSRLSLVSFELLPPRRDVNDPKFWSTVNTLLSAHPDFMSVTYGAGGKNKDTARDVVTRIVRDTPIQPIAHLTCSGMSGRDVDSVIHNYFANGVRTFLALRGDPPVDNPQWQPGIGDIGSATELITRIRRIEAERCDQYPGVALRNAFRPLTIAVATFPGGNPAAGTTPDQEVERLLVKQAAGASFAITQLFWEAETYISFVDKARACGVTIPIVPGILPPTQAGRVRRLTDLTGVQAPQHLLDSLDHSPNPHITGITYGSELASAVLEAGAPGLHLYTFNQAEPALDLMTSIGLSASVAA